MAASHRTGAVDAILIKTAELILLTSRNWQKTGCQIYEFAVCNKHEI